MTNSFELTWAESGLPIRLPTSLTSLQPKAPLSSRATKQQMSHEVAVIRMIGIGDIGRKGFKLRIVLLDREN